MSFNRLVDWICESRLIESVKKSVQEHLLAFNSLSIENGLYFYRALSQCASLVGAEHVHAPKVLNGTKPFYDHFLGRHLLRSLSKIDTNDSGKKLRSQSHGKRQGKKKRF